MGNGNVSNYHVNLYSQHSLKVITVDSFIPCCVDKGSPLFISDKKECWPMMVEKALAKLYKSYHNIGKVRSEELLNTLTGYPTITKPIEELSSPIQYCQSLTDQGYAYVLIGRKGSYLCEGDEDEGVTFNVLSFYMKGTQRLALINCSFVDEAWL